MLRRKLTRVWSKDQLFKNFQLTAAQWIFIIDVIHGMMEAFDFDSTDNVSPSLGGLLDNLYGLTKNGKNTSTITRYADKVNVLFNRSKSFEWCGVSIRHLQARVQGIEEHTKAAFGKHQTSKMLAQKWLASNHLCDAVRHIGGVESLHANVSEASHKQFNAMYALDSQRRRSEMEEIVLMQNIESPKVSDRFFNFNRSEKGIARSSREARKVDLTVHVLSNGKSTLLVLELMMMKVE